MPYMKQPKKIKKREGVSGTKPTQED